MGRVVSVALILEFVHRYCSVRFEFIGFLCVFDLKHKRAMTLPKYSKLLL
jgi:hypothetical protein